MKYLYMNEQEWQIQYYQLLFICCYMTGAGYHARINWAVKINGGRRCEAMANDNMQTMKNILKI